jgi:hypothetical protein
MICLSQQKTIHEHKLMLEENNPRDFMDVYLQQMEAEKADDNSTFTGSCIIPSTWVHMLWYVSLSGVGLFLGSYKLRIWTRSSFFLYGTPKLITVFTMCQWALS